jgi:hypothetical protein
MLFKGCGGFICASSSTAGHFHFYSIVHWWSETQIADSAWRDVEGFSPQDLNSKLATYQSLFTVPFDLNVRGCPCSFAAKFVFRSVSTSLAEHWSLIWLRAHTLNSKDSVLGTWNLSFMWPLCLWADSRCKHALLMCRETQPDVCTLRRKFASSYPNLSIWNSSSTLCAIVSSGAGESLAIWHHMIIIIPAELWWLITHILVYLWGLLLAASGGMTE